VKEVEEGTSTNKEKVKEVENSVGISVAMTFI
jgi:hypothetical protein